MSGYQYPVGQMSLPERRPFHKSDEVNSFKQAASKRQKMIQESDSRQTSDKFEDLPKTDADRVELIKRLWQASFNLEGVQEPETSLQYRYMADKDKDLKDLKEHHFSDRVVEVILWGLLSNIEEAQRGICAVPFWYSTLGPQYQEFGSFTERFEFVETALMESKACCCSLFSISEFAARLAWNPQKESKRKTSNRAQNLVKGSYNRMGMQVAKEKDYKWNEKGELQDKDGNQVPIKKKNKANGGVRKPSPANNSKSALAKTFARPGTVERLEREIGQHNENQSAFLNIAPAPTHNLHPQGMYPTAAFQAIPPNITSVPTQPGHYQSSMPGADIFNFAHLSPANRNLLLDNDLSKLSDPNNAATGQPPHTGVFMNASAQLEAYSSNGHDSTYGSTHAVYTPDQATPATLDKLVPQPDNIPFDPRLNNISFDPQLDNNMVEPELNNNMVDPTITDEEFDKLFGQFIKDGDHINRNSNATQGTGEQFNSLRHDDEAPSAAAQVEQALGFDEFIQWPSDGNNTTSEWNPEHH